jgi:hypothetical protein
MPTDTPVEILGFYVIPNVSSSIVQNQPPTPATFVMFSLLFFFSYAL